MLGPVVEAVPEQLGGYACASTTRCNFGFYLLFPASKLPLTVSGEQRYTLPQPDPYQLVLMPVIAAAPR